MGKGGGGGGPEIQTVQPALPTIPNLSELQSLGKWSMYKAMPWVQSPWRAMDMLSNLQTPTQFMPFYEPPTGLETSGAAQNGIVHTFPGQQLAGPGGVPGFNGFFGAPINPGGPTQQAALAQNISPGLLGILGALSGQQGGGITLPTQGQGVGAGGQSGFGGGTNTSYRPVPQQPSQPSPQPQSQPQQPIPQQPTQATQQPSAAQGLVDWVRLSGFPLPAAFGQYSGTPPQQSFQQLLAQHFLGGGPRGF